MNEGSGITREKRVVCRRGGDPGNLRTTILGKGALEHWDGWRKLMVLSNLLPCHTSFDGSLITFEGFNQWRAHKLRDR